MIRLFTTAFAALLIAPAAHAGFYGAPVIAYSQGTTDVKTTVALGSVESKATQTGILFGGELGWTLGVGNGLNIGLEYLMGNVDSKADSTGTTTKYATNSVTLIVGYHFPQMIIGYVGIGQLTATDDAIPKTVSNGTVLKLGAHKTIVDHVSAGAEYQLHTWNDYTTEGSANTKFTDVYEKYNASAIMGFVRFPFGDAGKK